MSNIDTRKWSKISERDNKLDRQASKLLHEGNLIKNKKTNRVSISKSDHPEKIRT